MSRAVRDSALIPFRFLLRSTLSSNIFGLSLTPNNNLSPRLTTEADAWALYRIRKLKVRLHPGVSGSSGDQVVGYIGGNQDTAPSSIANVSELLNAVVLSDETTVPSEWCKPGQRELAGMFPWYKTVAGTADTNEEAPGAIYIAGSGAMDNFILEIRGVYEFKTAVATANTPLAIECHRKLREERRAAQLLKEKARITEALGASVPQQAKTPTRV